jgi:hypothetical protein
VVLDRDAQLREGALLWSLGVDAPVSEPTVLVLYGRARRAGDPVLITPETRVDASRELLAQLALVGESCECDTSRAWTEEPAGLVPWTRTTHKIASKSLGFDPESPLVRNEVVRILGQPPAERSGKKPRPQSLEELLLGYGETTLAPIESTPAETSNDGPERDARTVAPPARVVGGTDGDDWSFGESSTNETRTRETDSGGSQASRALWIVSGVSILAILVALVLVRRAGVGP